MQRPANCTKQRDLKSSHHPCLQFLWAESHSPRWLWPAARQRMPLTADPLAATSAAEISGICYFLRFPGVFLFVCFGFSCFCFYSLLIHWLCMWVCVHALVSRHLVWVGCLLPHGSWRLPAGTFTCWAISPPLLYFTFKAQFYWI